MEIFGICHVFKDGSHGAQVMGGDVFLGEDHNPVILDDVCHGEFQVPSLETSFPGGIEEGGG